VYLRPKTGNAQAALSVAAPSVDQSAQQTSANTADDGTALAIDSISTGGTCTCSDHLTGRTRSKQKQRKDRPDRKSGSHVFVSFTPVNRRKGLLFHSLNYFILFEDIANHLLIL